MVLQRDRPIHIWGWSDPGETVTVSLNGATGTDTGDKYGRWSVYLPPLPAGGPYEVKVSGSSAITLEDVLVGDVWFASGQSNMEMPLKGFTGSAAINNSEAEIRSATNPNIRLLLIPKKVSNYPLVDAPASWTVCTPETAGEFSAAAYFFGRDVQSHEKVPIGLIDSTWGGTPVEAWMSMDGISRDASLMPIFAAWARMTEQQTESALLIAAEKREDEAAKKAGKPAPHHDWHPDPASWAPAALYNGMIAPFVEFPIKGAIWYQGESNASPERAGLYEKAFSGMIADWRTHWHVGDFPFLFVQIANFGTNASENWSVVRDAQRRTLAVANTAMAVTIDIGDANNVHPADKQDVGARLALGARAIAYGEKVEYAGPLFRQATVEGEGMRVWFDHADGLQARGGELIGFEIAGADKKFVGAVGRIEGRSVFVSNHDVPRPMYVRYGWRNTTTVINLYNEAGLPASPFTSGE
jgi:sialate O-acetylesterase